MSDARVSVIIPARDAAATLPRALRALADQALARCEVIVVDNGSRDETAALAARSRVVTRVVRRERGAGPGAARNAGVAAATGAVLAFLDADCRPAEGWLAAGADATRGAELVQGRVLPDPEVPAGPWDRTVAVATLSPLFESANLFVRRALFEQLGGFSAGLETDGGAPFGEDVIFGWRARRAGARTSFCEHALAYHEVRPRSAAEFIAERTRLGLFAALAACVPELRESFFYRRYFLSKRSASFDLALAAGVIALLSHHPLPLAAAAPYARAVISTARRWGLREAPKVAATESIADAVGALAMLRGSLASRSWVL